MSGDDTEQVSVEATGETVGEAKWKALRDLERLAPGLDKAAVEFQVVSEGERGLLGVGYAPARVVATAVAGTLPAALPSAGRRERRRDACARARRAGRRRDGDRRARRGAARPPRRSSSRCSGGELGLLIGKHGQTIDALQAIANAAVYRSGTHKSVTVDAAGYRDRRRQTLEGIADRSAERAARGERVLLEPMSPVERKVVHERLKEFPGVQTASEGTEPNRYVVVLPA